MPPKKKIPTDSISITAEKPKMKAKVKSSRKKSGGNAVYILLIMFLLCIIAVMGVNYFKKDIPSEKNGKTVAAKENSSAVANANEPLKEKSEETPQSDNPPIEQKKIKIYFIDLDPKSEKMVYRSGERTISGKDPIKQSLELLIKGLNADEKSKGYLSGIPANLKINSITQSGDIARIDLSDDFLKNAYGDIATGRLNQIFLTSTQFPGVKGIEILVKGKKIRSIGGDGIVIHWPMRKKL